MLTVFLLGIVLPTVWCSGEGNFHLLENEVADAIRACVLPMGKERQRRALAPRGLENRAINQYGHERRNTSDMRDQIHVLNATDYDYEGYGAGDAGETLLNSGSSRLGADSWSTKPAMNGSTSRTKRADPLFSKSNSDQCLSQCVFANLQVVDARGIPREAELWNRVQSSVTSQQSRGALRDQLRACFQELESEAEDDGCSYSNKLERCLMLRFSDRKTQDNSQKT